MAMGRSSPQWLIGIPALLIASSVGAQTTPHTFRFAPPPGTPDMTVSVAGDFNGWSCTANPLVRGADGAYSAKVDLPSGLQHYKLVEGDKWLPDPAADKSLQIDNGFGDVLSGIDVPAPNATAHAFTFVPPPGSPAVPVSVAGDFNGWSATMNPMLRGRDGNYSAYVQITPGTHHYKIVYDGKWIADPGSDRSLDADDGFGGKNSGIVISEAGKP